ncbi:hypothetical protein QAD02_013853 [Eretmocerus hayati]|uniref:Uncharacterized protein n=1 Tax=Eretmocerus hayati TaxID=131215 RepID=A0ACC2P3Q7_9HYME|nr:hypothetical protein QAD02_013853 [Eretmocerus hayati]
MENWVGKNFKSMKDLDTFILKYCRKYGKELSIHGSHYNEDPDATTPYHSLNYKCGCYGKPRKVENATRKTNSKKCECPFIVEISNVKNRGLVITSQSDLRHTERCNARIMTDKEKAGLEKRFATRAQKYNHVLPPLTEPINPQANCDEDNTRDGHSGESDDSENEEVITEKTDQPSTVAAAATMQMRQITPPDFGLGTLIEQALSVSAENRLPSQELSSEENDDEQGAAGNHMEEIRPISELAVESVKDPGLQDNVPASQSRPAEENDSFELNSATEETDKHSRESRLQQEVVQVHEHGSGKNTRSMRMRTEKPTKIAAKPIKPTKPSKVSRDVSMEIETEDDSTGEPRFQTMKMETAEDANDISIEEPRRTRGRPKEHPKTAIGLPRIRSLQPFNEKSKNQKARLMLSLVMKSGSTKNVMSLSSKLKLIDISHLSGGVLPDLYACDAVDISILEPYLEEDASKFIKRMQSYKKKRNLSMCTHCGQKNDKSSLACQSCLSRHHKKCVNWKSGTKNVIYVCKYCKTQKF